MGVGDEEAKEMVEAARIQAVNDGVIPDEGPER